MLPAAAAALDAAADIKDAVDECANFVVSLADPFLVFFCFLSFPIDEYDAFNEEEDNDNEDDVFIDPGGGGFNCEVLKLLLLVLVLVWLPGLFVADFFELSDTAPPVFAFFSDAVMA